MSRQQPAWLRLIIDHNPFFLLSAVCMMVGCHALNLALYTPAGEVSKLLVLLVVINVYELAVIGLAVALRNRTGPARRDPMTLLSLEALFLADSTFVAGVISTIDARWGWAVDVVLLALGAVKIGVAAWALRFPRPMRVGLLAMLQLAVLLLVPTVFKQIAMSHHGFPPELMVYFTWWAIGLLPVAAAALLWPPFRAHAPARKGTELIVPAFYVAIPFMSVLVHVYGAGWVYNFYLHPAEVSPVLIGLAVGSSALRGCWPGQTLVKFQITLLGIAMLMALGYPKDLVFAWADVQVTPVLMSGIGVAAAALYLIWLARPIYAVVAAVLGGIGWVGWAHFSAICACVGNVWRKTLELIEKLFPTTTLAWGVVAVVSAFVLLGIGAIFSFWRDKDHPADSPATPAPEPVSPAIHD